jgi:hypothetical protein
MCPDVLGDYAIKGAEGQCLTFNKNASQSIDAGQADCSVHFSSLPQQNGGPGINGEATLDEMGNFANASLYEGKSITARSPCSGLWDAGNSRMTIKCGGPGDQCTVVLERL